MDHIYDRGTVRNPQWRPSKQRRRCGRDLLGRWRDTQPVVARLRGWFEGVDCSQLRQVVAGSGVGRGRQPVALG